MTKRVKGITTVELLISIIILSIIILSLVQIIKLVKMPSDMYQKTAVELMIIEDLGNAIHISDNIKAEQSSTKPTEYNIIFERKGLTVATYKANYLKDIDNGTFKKYEFVSKSADVTITLYSSSKNVDYSINGNQYSNKLR